ncbi:putative multicopper oxidase, type 1 [Aureobasidium pullulans]|uniref:laccase n=1 Tax=Aureobasidium pullulans TaxID=5580 RepID=A0A4S8Y3X6_AURPU|nr:putative multicopper oxidase, type 1 [Aureobasidium pullulans]
MHFESLTAACLLALASVSSASSSGRKYLWGRGGQGKMVRRQASSTSSAAGSTSTLVADSACSNGPFTRSCWTDGFSVATDFDQKFPTTGNTVSYNLEITNTTCNPDGANEQQCLLINGQLPGPVIRASWGDTLSITVTNFMQDNGTSIHWHGIRQFNSPGMDGVNGVSECALAPGQTKTYTFKCTQYGSSWYHSHYSSQYGMGVVGTILIDGPATANYDIDLGTFPMMDWYYKNADVVNTLALINSQAGGGAPPSDTLLLNGTNNNGAGGKYQSVALTKGKKHRLRLINTSVDSHMLVKLDGHSFSVIEADFIPVEESAVDGWLLIAIGQRYDVVFEANQTSGNYWFRAEVATECGSVSNGNGRAIFRYDASDTSTPEDTTETPPTVECIDFPTIPYWKQSVDKDDFAQQAKTLSTGFGEGVTVNGESLLLWHLNTTAMSIHWDKPTLGYVFNGSTSYPQEYDVIEIPNEGVWTYWVIQQVSGSPPITHPIHLHGHDFFVLGHQASSTFDASSMIDQLNFDNPPRRDTATLPASGWLVLAFPANNPGSWLMHCHIAWHISEGLGVQFLEAKNQIVLPDEGQFTSQCSSWKQYTANMAFPQIDSGL